MENHIIFGIALRRMRSCVIAAMKVTPTQYLASPTKTPSWKRRARQGLNLHRRLDTFIITLRRALKIFQALGVSVWSPLPFPFGFGLGFGTGASAAGSLNAPVPPFCPSFLLLSK